MFILSTLSLCLNIQKKKVVDKCWKGKYKIMNIPFLYIFINLGLSEAFGIPEKEKVCYGVLTRVFNCKGSLNNQRLIHIYRIDMISPIGSQAERK